MSDIAAGVKLDDGTPKSTSAQQWATIIQHASQAEGAGAGVLGFVFAHLQSEADWRQDLVTSLYESDHKKLNAVIALIQNALDNCIWGGTAAQYEATLSAIGWALHPPKEIIDAIADGTYIFKYRDGEE